MRPWGCRRQDVSRCCSVSQWRPDQGTDWWRGLRRQCGPLVSFTTDLIPCPWKAVLLTLRATSTYYIRNGEKDVSSQSSLSNVVIPLSVVKQCPTHALFTLYCVSRLCKVSLQQYWLPSGRTVKEDAMMSSSFLVLSGVASSHAT